MTKEHFSHILIILHRKNKGERGGNGRTWAKEMHTGGLPASPSCAYFWSSSLSRKCRRNAGYTCRVIVLLSSLRFTSLIERHKAKSGVKISVAQRCGKGTGETSDTTRKKEGERERGGGISLTNIIVWQTARTAGIWGALIDLKLSGRSRSV